MTLVHATTKTTTQQKENNDNKKISKSAVIYLKQGL